MAIISIREYGMLHVDELDVARPSVTIEHADFLTNLKPVYGFEIFKYVNRNTLAARQYVGVIQLGRHTVEVLPKIDGSDQLVRRNLVAMLGVVLDLKISEGDVARVARQSSGILEILIRIFCDKLFAQIHRGLVRTYEGREADLSVMRGKLGIAEQIRRNAGNPERLFCRFDEFTEDSALNQILKAGIRLLLGVSRDQSNQRKLAELMLVFDEVSTIHTQALPWDKVIFNRLSERYEACFKLAELFLKRYLPDVSGGAGNGYSLFFDMNVLFEEYIGRIVKKNFSPLGYRVVLQGPRRYLAIEAGVSQNVFAMKPDVVGLIGGKSAWIVDTKWKPLSLEKSKEGVSQDDLYQMYAYANCYDCEDVVLLYPHHEELSGGAGVRNVYELNPWSSVAGGARRRVHIASVDIRELHSIPDQLRKIIPHDSYPIHKGA